MRRKLNVDDLPRPIFVWEPVPDLCVPSQLLKITNALPLVDVCSPNHSELASLMGDETKFLLPSGEINTIAVERSVEQLLASMPLQSYSLVVRCGPAGCYVGKNGGRKRVEGGKKRKKKPSAALHGGLQPDTDMEALFAGLLQEEDGSVAFEEIEVDPGVEKWFPAYHKGDCLESGWETETDTSEFTEEDDISETEQETPMVEKRNPLEKSDAEAKPSGEGISKVVDPTGGGNAFMGALGAALARGNSIEEAAMWGSVAASFAIEQVGVPIFGQDTDGNETWNGARVEERLREFKERL